MLGAQRGNMALSSRAHMCGGAVVQQQRAARVAMQRQRGQHLSVSAQAGKPAAEGKGKKKAEEKPQGLNLSFEDGIFAPAVRVSIALVGLKKLNKVRGKAIALHSQVITSFCKQVGAPAKTKQGLIRLAKKNGHKLGFLVTEPAW